MTIATIERAELIANQLTVENKRSVKLTKIAGDLIARVIAVRRNSDDPNRIRVFARRLSHYEGLSPDPFNPSRSLKISRLIATIDRGVYNRRRYQ